MRLYTPFPAKRYSLSILSELKKWNLLAQLLYSFACNAVGNLSVTEFRAPGSVTFPHDFGSIPVQQSILRLEGKISADSLLYPE